jgi:hypothetical protein
VYSGTFVCVVDRRRGADAAVWVTYIIVRSVPSRLRSRVNRSGQGTLAEQLDLLADVVWVGLGQKRLAVTQGALESRLATAKLTGLGRHRAVIGLGDEESAVAFGCGDGLVPRRGFGRGQRGEDLLLVALDAL